VGTLGVFFDEPTFTVSLDSVGKQIVISFLVSCGLYQ
jgi:hypothetical protein